MTDGTKMRAPGPARVREGGLAAGLGAVAGVLAMVVFWLMTALLELIWSGPEAWWYTVLVILAGGGLIALLQRGHAARSFEEQVAELRHPDAEVHHDALYLGAIAVVSVACGGALGPEAGILALIGQLSTLVARALGRTQAERGLIGEIGAAGALGGLYASPAGGAAVAQAHPEAPKWQLYLAGLAGLAGFLGTASLLPGGAALHVDLPDHSPAGDGSDMLFALLPALAGGAMGLLFAVLLPRVHGLLDLAGSPTARTLLGSALFALLCALLPLMRFSGHDGFDGLLDWGDEVGMAALILVAALKVLALSLCLAAGWRGGAIFPLLFAGAAAGAAVVWLIPATPVVPALVGGIAAAVVVGLGKPIAALLVVLLMVGPTSMSALFVGVAVGWGLSRLVPEHSLH